MLKSLSSLHQCVKIHLKSSLLLFYTTIKTSKWIESFLQALFKSIVHTKNKISLFLYILFESTQTFYSQIILFYRRDFRVANLSVINWIFMWNIVNGSVFPPLQQENTTVSERVVSSAIHLMLLVYYNIVYGAKRAPAGMFTAARCHFPRVREGRYCFSEGRRDSGGWLSGNFSLSRASDSQGSGEIWAALNEPNSRNTVQRSRRITLKGGKPHHSCSVSLRRSCCQSKD